MDFHVQMPCTNKSKRNTKANLYMDTCTNVQSMDVHYHPMSDNGFFRARRSKTTGTVLNQNPLFYSAFKNLVRHRNVVI